MESLQGSCIENGTGPTCFSRRGTSCSSEKTRAGSSVSCILTLTIDVLILSRYHSVFPLFCAKSFVFLREFVFGANQTGLVTSNANTTGNVSVIGEENIKLADTVLPAQLQIYAGSGTTDRTCTRLLPGTVSSPRREGTCLLYLLSTAQVKDSPLALVLRVQQGKVRA